MAIPSFASCRSSALTSVRHQSQVNVTPRLPHTRVYALNTTYDAFANAKKAVAVVLGTGLLIAGSPAMADLNKYEAAVGGEFGKGTALQYGEADIAGKDFHGEVRPRRM